MEAPQLLSEPSLSANQVQIVVAPFGGDRRDALLEEVAEDLQYVREDLACTDDENRRARLKQKLEHLHERRRTILGRGALPGVRVTFVVPNRVYEEYQADTDCQFRVSQAMFGVLGDEVGEEKLSLHLFDIKIRPHEDYWECAAPAANSPHLCAVHGIEDLRSEFRKAIGQSLSTQQRV